MKQAKQQLRHLIRQQRKSLTAEQQAAAAQALLKKFIDVDLFSDCYHIAAYVAHQGEIDPQWLMTYLLEQGKNIYLPIVSPHKNAHVHFIKIKSLDMTKKNRFGISEPIFDLQNEISPEKLDLVFVPLVAFDQNCHRLGMGGGYYDRVFRFLKNEPSNKPFLLGLAHDFQYRESLPKEDHDVPLHAVLTEKAMYTPRR